MSPLHSFILCSPLFPSRRSHHSLHPYPSSSNSQPSLTCKATLNQDPNPHPVSPPPQIQVQSVNYFISRLCNYTCKFCFQTAKNSHMLSLKDAKKGLRLLQQAGTQEINFAGGEPFIHPVMLGQLCQESYDLGLAVSIVTNGSLVTPEWMQLYARYVDIFGVSIDSFDPATNAAIGRGGTANNRHVQHVFKVCDMCARHNVAFKMNTVVCTLNWAEDMCEYVAQLDPIRWKVFQCLILGHENAGLPGELRDATKLVVSDEQFDAFLRRHAQFKQLIPESNRVMQNSYLLLDEYMRFLDCSSGRKIPGASILDVGVHEAVAQSGFETATFEERGGVYDWKRHK